MNKETKEFLNKEITYSFNVGYNTGLQSAVLILEKMQKICSSVDSFKEKCREYIGSDEKLLIKNLENISDSSIEAQIKSFSIVFQALENSFKALYLPEDKTYESPK